MQNKLNKNIGLIIKYCDYFLEAFSYDEQLHTFIDVDGNEINPNYTFLYEEDIKDYLKLIEPFIECYKLIK